MQTSVKANKLAVSALSAFRKAHSQLEQSNDLHARAHTEHLSTASSLEAAAGRHRTAATETAQAIVENRRVQAKLAEFIG